MYTSPPLKIVCGPVFNVVHEHVTHFHCVVALEQPLLNIRCLLLLISMLWHRQAIFESKGDKLPSSAECRIRTWKSQDTYSLADWMPTHKPTELSRIKLKTWTQQPVPMMSEHSAHLTSLPFGFRTWLWRYTCLLLLISMLWHRQAIFESKGDKLSSSAECRIRTWKSQDTYSPADWMPTLPLCRCFRAATHKVFVVQYINSIDIFIYICQTPMTLVFIHYAATQPMVDYLFKKVLAVCI